MGDPQGRLGFQPIPPNEIPASVPFRLVLARTDELAVWMTNVSVYSSGMTFSVEASPRNGGRFLGMYGFGKPEAGHTPPMLFGIEDSAGTIVTNLPKTRSGLQPHGGGGGPAHQVMRFSLAPLPAPGTMGVYFAWPHFGIEEVRFDVDITAIHDAVADVVTLWPSGESAPLDRVDPSKWTTPEIEIPPGGWCESAAAEQKPPPTDPGGPRRINFTGH
ncbi:hypothetical protein [Prescottella agglutinans]|uniref:Uncharacterized protein n=1 Tax=Prescottella agglutinans TaxID=1644129 RepID=A0ABT6MKK3_9NOCA|nr:hypothetical protein [Prescottella agglutinans]MDH6284851.1 hypothetical protein [Prescottella agglutinans]